MFDYLPRGTGAKLEGHYGGAKIIPSQQGEAHEGASDHSAGRFAMVLLAETPPLIRAWWDARAAKIPSVVRLIPGKDAPAAPDPRSDRICPRQQFPRLN